MFKKFVSGTLVTLMILLMFLGCMSVYSMNKPAFKNVSKVISTKPAKQIPRALFTVLVEHNWKFIN